MDIFHYTDKKGWNGIRAQKVWRFDAAQPKDPDRPFGAYFTDIPPSDESLRTLHKRLRVPKEKQQYLFWLSDTIDLKQHNGGSGRDRRIYYSPIDYFVDEQRQQGEGETERFTESFS